jgi:hypothetical protein
MGAQLFIHECKEVFKIFLWVSVAGGLVWLWTRLKEIIDFLPFPEWGRNTIFFIGVIIIVIWTKDLVKI